MQICNKLCVIMGAAGGIGAAVARRFALEGARGIVLADNKGGRLQGVAKDVHGAVYIGERRKSLSVLSPSR